MKLALFATGLSGIVAEYILSTLASYFLGDSIIQWTMILSTMLFSMGLGSRISKYIVKDLVKAIIIVEFTLSVLVSFSSVLVYSSVSMMTYIGVLIYGLSILIGLLIGMEIPIAIRLNNAFEDLRVNVSSIIEKDYYGSLLGGVFFAFIGLPYFGLTYTPFILGLINFSVALVLMFTLTKALKPNQKTILYLSALSVFIIISLGCYFAKPIIIFGEQKKYKDKIVYSEQSRYQRIVMTQWNEHYWFFLNGNQQFSTLDESMYHEPLIHPAMGLCGAPSRILVVGGGDGCAVREVLKYESVKEVVLVDLDPAMTRIGKENEIIRKLNKDALHDKRVRILNEDGFLFINNEERLYDVIIVDLPDPRTLEISRMYSKEFYEQCYLKLRPNGVLVTQAGSPYYAMKAFYCIEETMNSAGLTCLPLHNQILTMGQWGWVIGVKNQDRKNLKERLKALKFENIETDWINQEAILHMLSFGKKIFLNNNDSITINTVGDPVLYKYYLKGNWDVY